ncbi:MAG: hypothetical protein ACYC6W_01510 [Nitrosotalea sp.]
MKSAYLLLLTLVTVVFLGFLVPQARADDTNGISIQNISVQPYAVKVGDSFTVTATLVNNSTVPIVVETGKCSSMDTQVPFFTVMFDNHAKIMAKNINCAGVGWSQILDPGKNIPSTSPDYTLNYTAIKSGTANVTVTFSYHVINQTDLTQPNIEQTMSKSSLFTIYDNNTNTSIPHHGEPLVTSLLTPLKQFKSGIAANDVKCKEGLHLMIEAEDGSPACVETKDAVHLFELGWTKQIHYYIDKQISHDVYSYMQPKVTLPDYSYDGMDKDGIVTINNETYYQTTFNYTVDNLPKAVYMKFQNITFVFPDGILNTPGGSFASLDVKFPDGSEEVYGGTVAFSDGVTGLAGISIPTMYGPSITKNSIIVLGNHLGPQAGLAIYQDKIKLLVSK